MSDLSRYSQMESMDYDSGKICIKIVHNLMRKRYTPTKRRANSKEKGKIDARSIIPHHLSRIRR